VTIADGTALIVDELARNVLRCTRCRHRRALAGDSTGATQHSASKPERNGLAMVDVGA